MNLEMIALAARAHADAAAEAVSKVKRYRTDNESHSLVLAIVRSTNRRPVQVRRSTGETDSGQRSR